MENIFEFTINFLLSVVILFPLLVVIFARLVEFPLNTATKKRTLLRGEITKTTTIGMITISLFLILFLLPLKVYFGGKLDLAVYVMIFCFPLLMAYFLLRDGLLVKRSLFIKRLIIGVLLIGNMLSLTLFYGVFIEPQNLVINNQEIDLKELNGFEQKILLLSDVHMGPMQNRAYIKKLVTKLNEIAETKYKKERKIILLMAGDFVASKSSEAMDLYEFGNLNKKYKTYAVLGNHDFASVLAASGVFEKAPVLTTQKGTDILASEVTRVLTESGVNVLRNQSVVLQEYVQNGQKHKLILAGVDDFWSADYDLGDSLKMVSTEDTVLLLAHNPDVVLDLQKDTHLSGLVDLLLAGHTHGGEIRIPTFGLFDKNAFPLLPIPTKLGAKYDKGYFIFDGLEQDTPLFITSGVGNSGTRVRLFNPPEIVEIVLK